LGEVSKLSKINAIILAAGGGTRMKSNKPKVIHEILKKPLVTYVIESAKEAGVEEVCVVVGHQSDVVKKAIIDDVVYAEQLELLGTGHAVMQADHYIQTTGKTLVLFGDTPLITSKTLKDMILYSKETQSDVVVLSTLVDNPTGYGRIIRDSNGAFVKSVEHKDASEDELKVNEINSGMYCFDSKVLKEALGALTNDNVQGEYYLPDTLGIIMANGGKVESLITDQSDEILGINTKVQLAQASGIMQRRINEQLMLDGVIMMNPDQTYISKDARIGQDTEIHPNTFIEGSTVIGSECVIGPNTKIVESRIADRVHIEQSTVLQSSIGNDTTVGPYAYIRPNSNIGQKIKIGDFVEIKNATIGDGTKVSHLTYIGDADVGQRVNFGCGTVVVNYDGQNKHRTTIEDDAFIGCNTNLVSPVTVHHKAYTAAGSTITKDVPESALGIARTRQTNIEEWAKRNR
jgi:bifunctional UDP-N-acetylglucosamine pyrophosphorylase/glucosamine-1-phosphate N-acetyltransferase